MELKHIQPGDWNSRAVVHGDVVYLSGIVADDKSLPTKGQTAQVLAKIDALLAGLGTSKSRVLSATVYLADLGEKDEMNAAWMAWMDPVHPPARAAVGVQLTPGTRVEIMCCAALQA